MSTARTLRTRGGKPTARTLQQPPRVIPSLPATHRRRGISCVKAEGAVRRTALVGLFSEVLGD